MVGPNSLAESKIWLVTIIKEHHFFAVFSISKCNNLITLESGINVGHEQNVQSYVTKNPSNLKISLGHGKIPKFNKCRAFSKAVGPGKKSKINNRRAYVYSGL